MRTWKNTSDLKWLLMLSGEQTKTDEWLTDAEFSIDSVR